ncbi:MAG: hypothetical protein WAM14_04320 [Candidatus Nitrosopolaris sp.]
MNRKKVRNIRIRSMYGDTEEEVLQNAKRHGIEVHGYTEESWNDEIAKNADHFRKLIRTS